MHYLSFKDFVDKYGLKNEATSNIKIKEILDTLSAFGILKSNSTGIYMRDDQFTTTSGKVNLHPTKGTDWVMYTNKNYFDSYGCPPPANITKQHNTQSRRSASGAFGGGILSEYQIQKDDSYYAAFCLYALYLTRVIGFKNAILNLCYQTFKLNK